MSKDLLFEEMSISNAVQTVANNVANELLKRLNNVNGEYVYIRQLGKRVLRKFVLIEYSFPIFQYIDSISAEIYFGETPEERNIITQNIDYGGTFEMQDRTISVSCLGDGNGNVDIAFFKSVISHELKHAYQEMLYNNKSLPFVFNKATNIINNPKSIGDEDVYKISSLLYYFNRNEINSKMEEIYAYLKTEGFQTIKEINLIPAIREYIWYKRLFGQINDKRNNETLNEKIKQIYGRSLKELIKIINLGINYFKVKVRKVIGRYKLEQQTKINERRNYPKKFYVR